MSKIRPLLGIALLLGTGAMGVASQSAMACGENKFRAGHGLRYQSHKAEVAGVVLVYSASKRDLAPKALTRAGHRVVVVDTPRAFAQALARDTFDVVIVPFSEAAAVAAQLATAAQDATLVPVVRGRAEMKVAQTQFGSTISSVAGSREIIGLINEIVESEA